MQLRTLLIRLNEHQIIELWQDENELYHGKVKDMPSELLTESIDMLETLHTSREDILVIYIY